MISEPFTGSQGPLVCHLRDLKLSLQCGPSHSPSAVQHLSPETPTCMSFCKCVESVDCQTIAPLCDHLGFSSFKKPYAKSIRKGSHRCLPL